MQVKSFLAAILTFMMMIAITASAGDSDSIADSQKSQSVTILYTNDVHTYINNIGKDADGNEIRLLNYASISALKNELISNGENVILVDAGDQIQGTAYGGLDNGHSVVNIMNEAGYDLATIGNHEFDYGMFRFFQLMDEAEFPYISCNFYDAQNGELILAPYKIITAGNINIGFIGISTPESITKSTPVYFMDENGNFLYNFYSGNDGQELYDSVQKAIDELKPQADIIIALGHLGVDVSSAPYRSMDVIANTEGLDAFIDGHSHTVMESDIVTDKGGNQVLLTQTGCYFDAIGKMTISENREITTELIKEYEGIDEKLDDFQKVWINEVDEMLGEQIAVSDTNLTITDSANGMRLVRRAETNLGDLEADAFFYYFNENLKEPCDLAFVNGGSVRTDITEGTITYKTAKNVNPFGNVACLVSISGQQLLDVLEKGAKSIGLEDINTGKPTEGSGFMQVAGLKYDIDTSIESTITVDDNDIWVSGPTGEYRVKNVQVYNRETGSYEPLLLDKKYRVASINYLLRNHGCGLSMLDAAEPIVDYVSEDYLVLVSYLKAFTPNESGYPCISTANSPLSQYPGYLINYENAYGAGRITIE